MPFCTKCGKQIAEDAKFCEKCGTPTTGATTTTSSLNAIPQQAIDPDAAKRKSQVLAVLMCFFFGFYGVHNFVTGRIAAGLIKLAMFFGPILLVVIGAGTENSTISVVGAILLAVDFLALSIIVLVELVKIVKGTYKDGNGLELDKKAPQGLTITLLVFYAISLGFTFIVGPILAAVAVPKMFGTVSMAKASEISTAFKSYKTMQEAYFDETRNVGNFSSIGYEAPGVDNSTPVADYIDLSDGGVSAAGIVAVLKQKLGECPEEAAFVFIAHNVDNSSIQWTCTIEDVDEENMLDCEYLLPAFSRLCK